MKRTVTPEWKKQLKKLWWLLLFPAAFLLKELAIQYPGVVEQFYTNGIYPVISSGVGWLFGIMPFSFAEFLLYGMIIALIAFIVVCIVKKLRKRLTGIRFFSWIMTLVIIIGIGFNAFYWMWGFNYFSYSVAYSMQLDVREREPQELVNLCVSLAYTANTLRETLPEDENGVFTYTDGKASVLSKIPAAYVTLGTVYPRFSRNIPPPKPVCASELLSRAGIAGIFIPFTEEANVNMCEPALLLASSAAHESAHLMGVAREDEANFIGYLACLSSKDPEIAYSGIMLALIHSGNALNDISPSAYSQLHALYSDQVKTDLTAYNAYRERYKGETEETFNRMNDSYLKSNNQEAGIISYGRMVDLLLAFYDAEQS